MSRAEGLPAAVSMLDRPAIAYYVGAEKGDPLAVLAFSQPGRISKEANASPFKRTHKFERN